MKNTNTNEYKASVKSYLTPIIIESLTDRGQPLDGNIFQSILGVAKSEMKHEFDRHGDQAGLCSWLQGLGMGIDFMNYRILEIAAEWHGCAIPENKKDVIIQGWFNHIAFKIIQFAR